MLFRPLLLVNPNVAPYLGASEVILASRLYCEVIHIQLNCYKAVLRFLELAL